MSKECTVFSFGHGSWKDVTCKFSNANCGTWFADFSFLPPTRVLRMLRPSLVRLPLPASKPCLMVIQFRPGPLLRLATLPPHPIACARIHLRPLSSAVPQKCIFVAPRTLHCRPSPSFTTSLILGSRSLSLGSIFNGFKVTPAPSPTVVAHITRLEAEANVYPHDVSKQLALYNALIETNLKASYDLVINRWERMCEFVRCSFAHLCRIATQRVSGLFVASFALGRGFPGVYYLSRSNRS